MKSCLVASALLLASSMPLHAADISPRPAAPPPPPVSTGPTFALTGYFWASALDGRAATLPPLPATNIDLTFADIMKDFNGGLMGAAEMRIERWSVIVDAMYTQVTPGGALPGPFFSGVELRSRSLTVEGIVLYRLYEDATFDFDLGGGVRFWHLNNRLDISPGILNLRIVDEVSESWADPIITARLIARLGGPWSLTFIGDVGGFDVGSRFTWQALGLVNYKFNANWEAHLGYRALGVNYRNGDFLYDVTYHGPLAAITYRF